MDASTLALGALAAIGVFALVALANEALRRRARMRRRLETLSNLLEADDPVPSARPLRDAESGATPLLAMLDQRYPLAGGARTGLAMTASAMSGALALVPTLLFFGTPLLVGVASGLALAVGLGLSVGSYLDQRKRLQFTDRFLVAIDDFQRLVRYGVASEQAFRSVTASAAEPARGSLQRVGADTSLGVPLGEALSREARRVRVSEMAMLAAIISTQSRTGGGLAESIGNLAAMLRERNDNRARTKAATSESRISLIILSFVPFAAIGIQAGLQPQLVDTLLGTGRHLLGIGVTMIVTGLVVAWFIVRSAER